MIFIDTSAFLALLLKNDGNHLNARVIWERLLDTGETLICSNYTLIETVSLIQNRVGLDAVRVFTGDMVPLLTIEWVDGTLHRIAVESLVTANRRTLSLVDCTSFAIMRKRGIRQVFSFDRHFQEFGFICLEA